MDYSYDIQGWFSLDHIDGRTTQVPPPNRPLDDGVEWNFTGYEWVAMARHTNSEGAPYVTPVPSKLTPRQFKQGLTRIGLRAAVEAAIVAADQDTKDWYFESTSFERANPVMNAMAEALGRTSADIDNLFRMMESK